ncbi:MAG TPA: alpha/beta fold hydrolase [Gemmatimonadaceae bacterium]|nr:alpha/beta fold hydrolase [Gemmatimonadaceae bacterium]
MFRRSAVVAVVLALLAACSREPVAPAGPLDAIARRRESAEGDQGPPGARSFGPDTYQTGQFTGQGTATPGLDCDKTAPDVRTCTGFLASAVDGALLDVTLEIPLKVDKPVPLVALIHGYAGSKTSSGDIARALVGEGYAVLRYSTRGFGDSWGQVNLVDVNAEVGDLRSMIAQVVDEPQYHLNASAVAVTGASYGGGHSWLAALQPTFATPKRNTVTIRTIVPIAAWSDLFASLVPNGRERESLDVPGGLKLSYVNGLYGSGIRKNPDRPYLNYPEYFIGWHTYLNATEPTSIDPVFGSIRDGLAAYRSPWWNEHFWDAVRASHIPVFMAQGFTDDLFPMIEAKRMLLALQTVDPSYPVAAYFGDIGHPRAANKTGEVEYALSLIRAWLAFYVKDEGAEPPHVVYAALTRPRDEAFDPANVLTVPSLAALSTDSVSASFDAPAVLVNPLTDPASGFFWDPLIMEGARELKPLPVPPESPLVPGSLATYDVPVSQFTSGALTIAGQPRVAFHASSLAPRVQLNVRLFDVDETGMKQIITRGTYTLQNPITGAPVGDVDVVIATYGNYWRVDAGHTLRLELTNVDSPYITPSKVLSETVVTGVRLDIPIR